MLCGHGLLCDRCLDAQVSAQLGLPPLPDPAPPPVVITDPRGRPHTMRYRVARHPAGLSVRLSEQGTAGGKGFAVHVLGDQDADVDDLAATALTAARTQIGRSYLELRADGAGWRIAGFEVAGRFECDSANGPGGPHEVIIDGQPLSWDELGVALATFEGWRFRLVIEDPSIDQRNGSS